MKDKDLLNVKDKDMPSPSNEMMDSDAFNAIWYVIKTWDINVPEFYDGYCGANGSHVKLIMDELNKRNCIKYRKEKLKRILKK
jgi:protein-disulfide isomerase